MQYFPIFVDGKQLKVLVVGGGEVATRKVELMLKTPAAVTVVSPDLSPCLTQLAHNNKITYIKGFYEKSLLNDKQLVFVATENNELNKEISKDATLANVLANVVDSPALCHFITPSIVDRTPMTFAMSSEGMSPVLLRYWRAKLETLIPHNLGEIAKFAGEKRQQVKDTLDNVAKRRDFWESFFSSSRSEDTQQLDDLFEALINAADNQIEIAPELYIIQTPTDPDSLTLGALRHMQKSDIAIFDDNINPDIVELIRRDAERETASTNTTAQIENYLNKGLKVCYLTQKSIPDICSLKNSIKSKIHIKEFSHR
ncbi:siroheme synthase [Pseudoalteromonas denitrificans]|uniref:precorrin-2 dehydrogenase n=1 Tax=Pseudoalteromonas denitrificans DSM 6059 TaxID=1123010 RepID=A0A1I1MS71_9GAMM|nr:NAD(P)-dependent oxidoreductase [Pseudoalteromonas denitrificans]SFC88294.1 precorrin-2 dehydrogenase [Pseudoalteromonas denitrificans DSM 6059]